MKNVYLIYSCLMLIQFGLLFTSTLKAEDKHIDKTDKDSRTIAQPKQTEECNVDPKSLTAFANGDSQNFKPVVTFITQEPCLNSARSIGIYSVKEGVNFESKLFKLDQLALKFPGASFEEIRAREADLIRQIPLVLRNENPKASTLFPIIGQLAVISPGAARKLLAETISIELQNSSSPYAIGASDSEPMQIEALAKSLMRMGADEPMISQEIARVVEEKAIVAESDSLKRMFLSLAKVASIQSELIPTFNEAAVGLRKGVERGSSIYQSKEKYTLLYSAFLSADAIKESAKGLDIARKNLDISIGILLDGADLTQSRLSKMWREVLSILALSDRFPLLAQALSDSLTSQAVYLGTLDVARLLSAGRNYPSVGFSIQREFKVASDVLDNSLNDRTISKSEYRAKLAKFFMPIASQILSWEEGLIDPTWVSSALKSKLILGDDVQKRFPKFILHLIDRRDLALAYSNEAGVEPVLSSMAENLAVLWSLGTVHVPALNKWLEDNE